MNQKIVRAIGAGILVALWLGLSLCAWFSPARDISDSERRTLAQMPEFSAKNLNSGKFMTEFESYTLDQFPLRDSFRRLKSLFHYYVLGQKDNNDIYLVDGSAAKLEYPLNMTSVSHALGRFNHIFDTYLKDTGSQIYVSVVPDKGYYLADKNGYPAMDYETLFDAVTSGMPWAEYLDITQTLDAGDYYRTDTHWRQEQLPDTAKVLCDGLGITPPQTEDYTRTALERPFYGVYYGQAALPMDAETMYILESDLLDHCIVYNHETGRETAVYDMDKLSSRDLYDVFLSGAVSLMTIENPNVQTDRELILFRDSFGSAITPLLLQGYRSVTLVDIRYVTPELLGQFVEFHGQDVLFLYSTTVLNNSSTLK